MRLLVDAIIYQLQGAGGVSRLFTEILPRLCDLEPALQIDLLVDPNAVKQPASQALPEHRQIRRVDLPVVDRWLRPALLWRPLAPKAKRGLRNLRIGRGRDTIWHSTYYTVPDAWAGHQVVTVYDMIHERYPDLFNRPQDEEVRASKRRSVMAADFVICISETTRADVLGQYDLDPTRVGRVYCSHGDAFRRREGAPPSGWLPTTRPYLLYAGRRMRYKGFADLLLAYGAWQRRAQIDLVVVGKPWSTADQQALDDLGVRDQVHLLTGISDDHLCWLYNRAAAFVYPSWYEGFGIPLLEAMASGCPVIASDIPSTREVADVCPFYFEPGNVESMQAAFDAALTEGTLTEGREPKRLDKGLARVERFSWQESAMQTLAIYRQVAGLQS